MHLTYRPGGAEDVDVCAALMPPAFARLAPDIHADLPVRWRRWLREGVSALTIVEDAERADAEKVVAFGASVFVTERFADAARVLLPPPVGARVTSADLLGLPDIRAASSGDGLTLFVPYIGWNTLNLDPDDVRWVKARLIEAFFFAHAGFRIKEFLQEIYSDDEKERGVAAGLTVLRDYAETPAHALPPTERPCLAGVTRDTSHDGTMISPLFFYRPPRFGFRGGEQAVLSLALTDKSDDEIARALAVSPATVHKRWQVHPRTRHLLRAGLVSRRPRRRPPACAAPKNAAICSVTSARTPKNCAPSPSPPAKPPPAPRKSAFAPRKSAFAPGKLTPAPGKFTSAPRKSRTMPRKSRTMPRKT